MFEQTFKNIDDVLWKEAGCSSELDYTEQTSWLLFLKYFVDLESGRAMEAELVGKNYDFIIEDGYRWPDWAAPKKPGGRFEHDDAIVGDDLINFVDGDAVADLGSVAEIRDVFVGFQEHLYSKLLNLYLNGCLRHINNEWKYCSN